MGAPRKLVVLGALLIVPAALAVSAPAANAAAPAGLGPVRNFSNCTSDQARAGHYFLACSILDWFPDVGEVRGHIRIYCYTAAGNEPCEYIIHGPTLTSQGAEVDLYHSDNEFMDSTVLRPCLSFGDCPVNGVSGVTGLHSAHVGDCYEVRMYTEIKVSPDIFDLQPLTLPVTCVD